MARIASILGVIALFAAPAWSDAPPPIGEEVVLDHGFRYQDAPSYSVRCAITTADSIVLLAYGDQSAIRAHRRTWSGKEVDLNSAYIGPTERYAGAFDLSGFDGSGWKMVYLSDTSDGLAWRTLWLRNLDPQTLGALTPDLELVVSDGQAVRTPMIVWNGSRHLVAWIEESGRFMMRRVRPDMTLEDPAPISLASAVTDGAASLAAGPGGGVAAWIGWDEALVIQFLDAEGLPAGSAHIIDTGTGWSSEIVDVCPYGDDWLVAWTNGSGISFALVDSQGAVMSPGIKRVATALEPEQGLTVAAAGSTCVLAWRGGDFMSGAVTAVRVIRTPMEWTLEPITTLPGVYAVDTWGSTIDRRNLDAAWTGAGFALLWNTWVSPPIAQGSASAAGGGRRLPTWPSTWPVYHQWLSPLGAPLTAEPVMTSVGSRPNGIGVHYGDGRFLALIADAIGQPYMHALDLGSDGSPAPPATRFRTPIDEPDCDWTNCETSQMVGMAVRSSDPDALLLYGFLHHVDGSIGTWIDESRIVLDRVAADGSNRRRSIVLVDQVTETGFADPPQAFDVARGADSYLLAFQAGGRFTPTPQWLRVKLMNLQGTVERTWDVLADSSASSPSVAAIGSRFLLVWLDGAKHTALRSAIIDPAVAGSTITGTAVPGVSGSQGTPYLVPGPAQTLCVFPSRPDGTSDFDIFAQRYGADGTLLDPIPIPICPAPGNQGLVTGIWDSNQYLVTWSNTDQGAKAILGGRVAASGIHFDTTGFLIQDGAKGPVSLASDEYGRVVAAYGGNRLRTIDDLIPLLDESDWPDDPLQSDGVIPLQIGRVTPNPGLGQLHLDISLPLRTRASIRVFDAAGRLVADRIAEAADLANGWTWNGHGAEGLPAPAGVYFFKISTTGREFARSGVLLR